MRSVPLEGVDVELVELPLPGLRAGADGLPPPPLNGVGSHEESAVSVDTGSSVNVQLPSRLSTVTSSRQPATPALRAKRRIVGWTTLRQVIGETASPSSPRDSTRPFPRGDAVVTSCASPLRSQSPAVAKSPLGASTYCRSRPQGREHGGGVLVAARPQHVQLHADVRRTRGPEIDRAEQQRRGGGGRDAERGGDGCEETEEERRGAARMKELRGMDLPPYERDFQQPLPTENG